jgi:hypothetical protein
MCTYYPGGTYGIVPDLAGKYVLPYYYLAANPQDRNALWPTAVLRNILIKSLSLNS